MLRLLNSQGVAAIPLTAQTTPDMQTGDVCVFSPAQKITPEIAGGLKNGIKLFAGNLTAQTAEILKQKNITHINFMADEVFAHKNAMLTAEGILALLIQNTPKSIYQNNILLLGWGRCAKAAARLFDRLGLNFAISASNKSKLPECFLFTQNCYFSDTVLNDVNNNDLQKFDVIINTIPTKIFNDEAAKKINKNALVIEVASVPCLDAAQAEKNGFTYLPAPGLPQLFCCEAAAWLMLETIEKNL